MFHKDSVNHFPDSTILGIQVDKRNKVWVCTQNGLYLFDAKTEKFEYYNPKLGLGHEAVHSVTLDNKDEYWIALENSLLRYNEKTGKIFRYGSEFGCNPGMFGLRPAYVDERNMLYYITLKGIMVIDPNDLNLNVDPPQLQFNRITNSGDTLFAVQLREWMSKPIELPYNKNFFTFEWSTNQVFTISPHRFEYRLIGLDSTWTDNGISNKISFTNLSSGTYTFEVRGQNAYGASSDVLRFSFFIDRPFWIKWWFILLVIVVLGALVFAYMKFRERQLLEAKLRLEKTVEERTEEVREKAKEVLHQKEIIQEKNKELTSSIVYAQRIQEAILPEEKMLQEIFPDSFVLFKPKDIVSGDFPWMCRTGNYFFWAVADCTGHGVPGGFMSMLGNSLLNQIVAEQGIIQPSKILDELRERVMRSLKQSGADGETRDGMDICLCRLDLSSHTVVFAGANNSVYLVRNGELREYRGNKQPVGIHMAEMHPFSEQAFEVSKGDCLYAFSDGYADQFGGEKGKKFKYSRFEELILKEHKNSMSHQSEVYWNTFETWRGEFEQVDDVCVIGVRV
jgi:serine phosphatase RsbU (regulator of sigma subunit)